MVENCVNISDEWIVDIFIHVVILVLVLTVAFWVLIAPLEKKEFGGQIKDQISNAMDGSFKNLSPADVQNLSAIDFTTLSKFYDRPDQTTKVYNDWLKKMNIVLVAVLFFSLGLVWVLLYLSCGKCVPFGRILLENFALFACIGAIEVAFFLKVASTFVPVKPSFMVQQFFADMKRKF